MQLSAFNLYVDDYPAAGQTLIHNTFSGAYVVIERAVVEALRRGEADEATWSEAIEAHALAEPDVGVLVTDRVSERAEYAAWFDRACTRGEVLQAIIGVNLACNFDCSYCCQADVMTGEVMGWDRVAATADWLADRADALDVPRVHVSFVGGEPLLHPRRIVALARRLRDRLAETGRTFTMGLITNGYFMTEELVLELVELGLVGAKVTLDGDGSTHCTTRVSKRGEDTFRRIFDNVIAASQHIEIQLNGNYQDDTIAGFGPLIEQLAEAGFPEGSLISFTPALEILAAPAGSGSGACNWSGSSHAYQVALYDEVVRNGYSARPLASAGPCGFHDDRTFAIGPDGTIYKCPGFIGHPQWGIGEVTGGLDGRNTALLAADPQRECGDCSHRPNCAGGCVAHEYLQSGRPEGINCEREYLDAVASHSVVREFAMATADDPVAAAEAFPPAPRPLPPSFQPTFEDPASRGRGIRSAALRVL